MGGSRWIAILSCVLCLCLPAPGQTQAGGTVDPFAAGNAAFRAGDYERALAYYEQARQAGRESPALTYNLAVTHFRLERYATSARHFHALTDEPRWRDLARYNLGLVAERRGHDREAVTWYRMVADDATDERLRRLASQRLEALRGERGPERTPARARGLGMIGVGAGFDGNVVAFPDALQEDASQAEDHFAEVIAYGEKSLGAGLRVYGMGYLRRHADMDAFDTDVYGAGMFNVVRRGDWRFEYGAGGSYAAVDGERVSTDWMLRMVAQRDAGAHQLRAAFRPAYHSAGNGFAHIDGTSYRFDTRWRYSAGTWRFTTGYRYEFNDRDDLDTGTEFFSHSPVRQRLTFDAMTRVAGRWSLGVGVSREEGRFRGINRMTDVDDEFVERRRRGTRDDAWIRGEMATSRRGAVVSELRYTDQDDTFEFFRYDRATFSLGYEHRW